MSSQIHRSQKVFIERVRRTISVGDDVTEYLHEGALNLQLAQPFFNAVASVGNLAAQSCLHQFSGCYAHF